MEKVRYFPVKDQTHLRQLSTEVVNSHKETAPAYLL